MSGSEQIVSNVGVCLYAEDVFGPGGALTLEECSKVLAPYNFSPIIHALAMLKHANEDVFANEPVSSAEHFAHLGAILRMLLTKEDSERVTPLCIELAEAGVLIPFSDRAILAAMELAGMCCDREGGRKLNGPGTTSDLGRVLFSLQSATLSSGFRQRIADGRRFEDWEERDVAEMIRNHLGHNSVQMFGSCAGRFFAYWRNPAILTHFKDRAGCTIDDWFHAVVGMSFEDYIRAAFFVSTASCRFKAGAPDWKNLIVQPELVAACIPERDRKNVRRLLDLAVQDPSHIGAGRVASGDIADFLYGSFSVMVRPFVRLSTHWIPLSQNLVLEKFLSAIPHLLDASHQAAGGKNIEGTRGPFGYLLEGYLASLFHGWFDGRPDIQVLSNYHYRDGKTTPEADILVIVGSTAFVFEVKAKVATLALRAQGMFGPISALILPSVKQALRVADAVLRGDAFRKDGTPITGIARIFPCAVVYDRVPLRPPISEHFEKHLEKELQRPIFSTQGPIMPLQFFDLETIEGWEDYMNLAFPSTTALAYLETRSVQPWLRHGRQFPHSAETRPRTPHGPHQRLVNESRVYFDRLAAEVRTSP